jgi:DNA modification methylase
MEPKGYADGIPVWCSYDAIVKLTDLVDNPRNPNHHPQKQIDKGAKIIKGNGIRLPIVVSKRSGLITKGHGRKAFAIKAGISEFPIDYQDYADEAAEWADVLADNELALEAEIDLMEVKDILEEIEFPDLDLTGYSLDDIIIDELPESSLDDGELPTPTTPAEPNKTLAEQFIVPPFSVLDARQGYWQERKKAWIAKGIKSELGRGDAQSYTDYDWCADKCPDKVVHPPNNGLLGFSEQSRSHYKNAAPGHTLAAACDYSNKERGDGAGKPMKGLARSNGQDLMKGENSNFDKKKTVSGCLGSSFPTIHAYDDSPEGGTVSQSGTSIFDPVLCELVYRWFCPSGGHVLDPFAGGSVRGIVAAYLGYDYTGIDLREEQIEANRAQWAEISLSKPSEPDGDYVTVKVSAKMAQTPFAGCSPEYIAKECHASCCQSSTSESGTMITIHPTEQEKIEARGGTVKDGLLQTPNKRCPFKTDKDLCGLHFTPDKPFGCIASPFTLNKNGTLIIRNRYKLLKCYNQGEKLPAYKAFRASLDLIFGQEESQRVCDLLEGGSGDIAAQMPKSSWKMLIENDEIKHGSLVINEAAPSWVVGDSRGIKDLANGSYDLVFSCPPYADLEVYSDDPKDLSTLDYPEFLASYREIIANSVSMLKPNRFACFVVGDIRDKKGFYRNFVSDTIAAFQEAGAILYNEAILVTAVGSLPIRVKKQFAGYRKLGKTHQNVLVFYKGNIKDIKTDFGEVEANWPDENEAPE